MGVAVDQGRGDPAAAAIGSLIGCRQIGRQIAFGTGKGDAAVTHGNHGIFDGADAIHVGVEGCQPGVAPQSRGVPRRRSVCRFVPWHLLFAFPL
ncbi:hypothetical protein D3C78_746170 [compost metagenome]